MSLSRSPLHLLSIAAVFFIGGCGDHATAPEDFGRELRPTASAVRSQPATNPDESVTPFATLDISMSGQSRAGQSAEVVVRAVFSEDVEAEVTLHAPEVATAEATSWEDGYTLLMDTPLPPMSRWPVHGVRNQSAVVSAQVPFKKPGIYQLVATARLLRAESMTLHERLARFLTENIWVLVTPNGMRILPGFDPQHVPEGMDQSPGPFRQGPLNSRPAVDTGSPLSGAGADVLQSTGREQIRILYYDVANATYRGVPGKEVEVTYYEYDYEHWEEVGGEGFTTNSYGTVYWDCPEPGYGGSFVVRSELSDASIKIVPNYTAESGYYDCQQSITLLLPEGAEVWKNMKVAAQASTQFGPYRGPIEVRLGQDGSFYRYTLFSEYIAIDDIWDPRSPWVHAHEYAHAFHHSLGGFPGCGQQHYLSDALDLECAFTEGFADYFANEFGPKKYYNFESRDYTIGCVDRNYVSGECLAWSEGPVGPLVEGAVASLLTDMTDYADDSGDDLRFPPSYIGQLVSTCQVGPYAELDGVDHFVYCAERSLSPYHDGYFRYRPEPLSFSESATEPPGWTAATVRDAWAYNLYRDTAPLHVAVSGPATAESYTTYTWYADVQGGNGSLTYTWYRRLEGSSTYSVVGTGQALAMQTPYTSFTLLVHVAATDQAGSATQVVQVTTPPGGGGCIVMPDEVICPESPEGN